MLTWSPFRAATSELDFDVDPRREVELHQRIDGLRRRVDVSSTRLWVRISNCSRDFLSICGERSTGEFLDLGRQRNRSAVPRPGPLAVATISLVDWSSTR